MGPTKGKNKQHFGPIILGKTQEAFEKAELKNFFQARTFSPRAWLLILSLNFYFQNLTMATLTETEAEDNYQETDEEMFVDTSASDTHLAHHSVHAISTSSVKEEISSPISRPETEFYITKRLGELQRQLAGIDENVVFGEYVARELQRMSLLEQAIMRRDITDLILNFQQSKCPFNE